MRQSHEYGFGMRIAYETLDRRLKQVEITEFDMEPDFEGIVFSIFALLAHAEEFTNIPEGGLTEEVRVNVFKRKQLYIRALISGLVNYLHIMNKKVDGHVDLEPYLTMSSNLGDVLVAMAATASNLTPEKYRELQEEFYNEYIEKKRNVKTQKENGDKQPSPKPRRFS